MDEFYPHPEDTDTYQPDYPAPTADSPLPYAITGQSPDTLGGYTPPVDSFDLATTPSSLIGEDVSGDATYIGKAALDAASPVDDAPHETSDGGEVAEQGATTSLTPEAETADKPAPEKEPEVSDTGNVDDKNKDNGGDNVPPDVPPTDIDVTGFGEAEPDRGVSLKRVIDYAAVAGKIIHDRILAEARANPNDWDVSEYMEETGLSSDAVTAKMARGELGGKVKSLRDGIMADELNYAELQYANALEASGLRLETEHVDMHLRLHEPEAFTIAVEQLEHPDSAEGQTRLESQVTKIIDYAVMIATDTLLADNPDAIGAACGGLTPSTMAFEDIREAPDREDRNFTEAFGENADRLARALTDKGVSTAVSDPLRQLSIARDEGLTPEWAVAVGLRVFANGQRPIGVYRLTNRPSWEPVYAFCDYLKLTAPNAQLTQEVKTTLLTDIEAVLNAPNRPGNNIGRTGREMSGRARLILEEAWMRIQGIQPPPA